MIPWGVITAKPPSCRQASSGARCGAGMDARADSRLVRGSSHLLLDGASVELLASFILGVEIFGKVTELEGGECVSWYAAPCLGCVLALTYGMGARGEEEELGYKCGATSQIGEILLLGAF